MDKNNTIAVQLQELAGKVIPTYEGDMKEALGSVVKASAETQFNRAVDVCLNFQPCNPNTTSEQWIELDWALTIPGVAEEFPELVSALEAHFSITLSYRDLIFMLEAAMEAGRTMDPPLVEESIATYWNQFGHVLPEDFYGHIEHMFHEIAGNKIGEVYPDDPVFGKEYKL